MIKFVGIMRMQIKNILNQRFVILVSTGCFSLPALVWIQLRHNFSPQSHKI